MKTYGYIRCSTIEQATNKSTLDDQSRRITGAAMMRGESISCVFSDPGVSGGMPINQRPAGGEMLAVLQPGDTVIAAKMDRIFRSAEDALVTAGRLQQRGVRLVIADMGPDPVTENGAAKLFFTMLAAFAEFERSRIAERVKDGRDSKSRRGGFIGGEAPYGFRSVGKGRDATLEGVPEEQAVIALARSLSASGVSLRGVARRLEEAGHKSRAGGSWHQVQIQRMLGRKEA